MTWLDTVQTLACERKRAFPCLEDAQEITEAHYSCGVCESGAYRMHAYRCPIGPHYHAGHSTTVKEASA